MRPACVAFALLCAAGLAPAQVGPGQRAVASPFDLAESIESGRSIDWDLVLPKGAADTSPRPLPRCGDPQYSPCDVELMVVQHPAQAILLVQQADVRGDFFVRFIGQGDQWSFGGSYLAPLKYYPSRHGMMRVSEKPFMKVSEQGISGTGLASEIEEWFDLTLPDFEPVFSFPVQGHQYLVPSDIGRAITGFAMEDRRSPVETIIADLTVRFSFGGTDIGQMESTGIYERPPGERRFSLRKALIDGYGPTATPIGTSDFENLADLDRGPANERILTYTFSRLKEIASGNDAEAKEAIRAFLEECQDTPEKRELEEVLKMR